jgi:hypothetical protein
MTETAGHQFFQKVLPECNAPQASNEASGSPQAFDNIFDVVRPGGRSCW